MTESTPIFTLLINKQPYQFDSNLFAKVSQKAAELIKENQYQAKVFPQISEEGTTAFVAACTYEKFQLTPAIAYELLDLSHEWKIPRLNKVVKSYIKERRIERQEPPLVFEDPLGDLLERQEAHQETEEDFIRVAKVFNKCLTDDRLFQVNVDNLCQIVHYANYEEIDAQLYLEFVLKMINEQPFTAVPLLLSLDFEKLQQDQDNEIFGTQEVHDANIGYFIALQLTALRNRAEKQRNLLDERLIEDGNSLQEEMKNGRKKAKEEANELFNNRMNHYREIINEQQKQIIIIKQKLEEKVRKHEEQTQIYRNETAQIREELDRQKIRINECRKTYDKILKGIQNELNQQFSDFNDFIKLKLDDVLELGNERRESIIKDISDPFNSFKRNFVRSKKNTQTIRNEIQRSITETQDMKSMLSAKMVQDFMRFDNFIRKNPEKRFKVFDEVVDTWGLSSAVVKDSDKELKLIEKRLDKLCPIRHALSQ